MKVVDLNEYIFLWYNYILLDEKFLEEFINFQLELHAVKKGVILDWYG
jgi:hypothetical protein